MKRQQCGLSSIRSLKPIPRHANSTLVSYMSARHLAPSRSLSFCWNVSMTLLPHIYANTASRWKYISQCVHAATICILRGVYSDTTQLNSTQLNSTQLTQLNSVQPSQSCFCLWRHYLQTESTGSLRSLIGDSWSRCERVDNSTSSWVELSCVAINTP